MSGQSRSAKVLGALVIAAVAVLLFSALAGADVDAAKGNAFGRDGCKGGPKRCGNGGSTTAVLTVSPNPVPLGSQSVVISGSGFAANQSLAVQLYGVCCFVGVTTDSNGAFSLTFYRNFDWPSTYTVEAYGTSGLLARTTFTVE